MAAQGQFQAFASDLTREARSLLRASAGCAVPGTAAASLRVTTSGDGIALGFPSSLADEGTLAALMAKVAEVAERHEVVMEVSRSDGAGGCYVLEGRVVEAPVAGPSP